MSDDRSERLRKRRKQSTESRPPARPDADSAEAEKPSAPSKPDESDDTPENGHATVSIKDEQVGTYMYLPESQRKELRRLYNVLKAEYEFKYGDEFEKNRHFYPLVVQFGLDGLDGLDASEIRTRLDEIS